MSYLTNQDAQKDDKYFDKFIFNSKPKQYKCAFCNKVFTERKNLLVHERRRLQCRSRTCSTLGLVRRIEMVHVVVPIDEQSQENKQGFIKNHRHVARCLGRLRLPPRQLTNTNTNNQGTHKQRHCQHGLAALVSFSWL